MFLGIQVLLSPSQPYRQPPNCSRSWTTISVSFYCCFFFSFTSSLSSLCIYCHYYFSLLSLPQSFLLFIFLVWSLFYFFLCLLYLLHLPRFTFPFTLFPLSVFPRLLLHRSSCFISRTSIILEYMVYIWILYRSMFKQAIMFFFILSMLDNTKWQVSKVESK